MPAMHCTLLEFLRTCKRKQVRVIIPIGSPLIHKIHLEDDELFDKDERACPICLEDFTDINNLAVLDVCRHKHCAACIQDLFAKENAER